MNKQTKLIAYRKDKKLTMERISTLMGVSRSYYEKVEYGSETAGLGFIKKFMTAFPDADIIEIFFKEN